MASSKCFWAVMLILLDACFFTVQAAPTSITPYIRVDQLGYLPTASKVAVVADPINGFNSAASYLPGTKSGQYQLRRWSDNVAVFSGTLTAWKGGVTHSQSGDRGWWFDFSSITTPGSYYVHDLGTGKSSGRFEISSTVYNDILRQVQRSFYVQRIGQPHVEPYSDARWSDAAPAYLNANQDLAARDIRFPSKATSARNLMGGWMDAGDTNKYVTFAEGTVLEMVEAYRANPGIFTDNLNIPESGNGRPDLLDELMWELDWLKRMQDATKTNGLFLKVGVDTYDGDDVSPLSLDTRPRYYVAECSSSTLSGAAMFAAAGKVLRDRADSQAYGLDLISRAEKAWARAKTVTANFTTFQTACDDGTVKAGDADNDAETQMRSALAAASYLFEATGKSSYRTFINTYYNKPYTSVGMGWWGPYAHHVQMALLRYASLPNATAAVSKAIKASKAWQNSVMSLDDAVAKTDLYRAYVPDDQFHWQHNLVRSRIASINQDFVQWGINPSSSTAYKNLAKEHLHWLHGVNPLGLLMFSNMGAFGAESSVRQIYHQWFADGTVWDDALTSPIGPAPGFMTGGPNKNYTGNLPNISNQPVQKAYQDTNSVELDANVWELSEVAIYSQSSYLLALSRALLP